MASDINTYVSRIADSHTLNIVTEPFSSDCGSAIITIIEITGEAGIDTTEKFRHLIKNHLCHAINDAGGKSADSDWEENRKFFIRMGDIRAPDELKTQEVLEEIGFERIDGTVFHLLTLTDPL